MEGNMFWIYAFRNLSQLNDVKPTHISNSKQYIPPENHTMNITSQFQDHLPVELCHAFEGMDFPIVFHCYSVEL